MAVSVGDGATVGDGSGAGVGSAEPQAATMRPRVRMPRGMLRCRRVVFVLDPLLVLIPCVFID
jgi:hypothetical protein